MEYNSLLKQIIKYKKQVIEGKKKIRDFSGAIRNPKVGNVSIIAEIKLKSPSVGRLGSKDMVIRRVKEYETGGADAISVVVDEKYFDGSYELLGKVIKEVNLPILAKDFAIDPYQIYEAQVYGADAILLIAKIIGKNKLKEFVKLSFEIGIEPVVEVQNEEELDHAVNTNTKIIAVNARDLTTFHVNIGKACRLIKKIPSRLLALGFSGVKTRQDIEAYKKAGAKGVLVGTSLMKAKNIGKFIKDLKGL